MQPDCIWPCRQNFTHQGNLYFSFFGDYPTPSIDAWSNGRRSCYTKRQTNKVVQQIIVILQVVSFHQPQGWVDIAPHTFSREINVAAQRKSRRLKSCTVSLLYFPRISSKVWYNFDFNASISFKGAGCEDSVTSLSPSDKNAFVSSKIVW